MSTDNRQEEMEFTIKLIPPRRKTASHVQAYERTKRFLEFASKPDTIEKLKSVKPNKRVRFLVTQFEEETKEHIPISNIYKLFRKSQKNEQTKEEKTTITEKTAQIDATDSMIEAIRAVVG